MLTVPQAAARAGRSPETIRRWIRAGKLLAHKVGTQHVIHERDLETLLTENEADRPAAAAEQAIPYGEIPAIEQLHDPLLERIVLNPSVLSGKPIVKGTRISVELVLEVLAAGWPIDEILENYPTITEEDIRACLAYAREVVASEMIFPLPAG